MEEQTIRLRPFIERLERIHERQLVEIPYDWKGARTCSVLPGHVYAQNLTMGGANRVVRERSDAIDERAIVQHSRRGQAEVKQE